MPNGIIGWFVLTGVLKTVCIGCLMSPKNEDASRIRQGYGAENLGLLRRLSVNLQRARTIQAESEDEALQGWDGQ